MPTPLLLVVGVVVGAAVGALVAYLWVGNANRQRDLVSNTEREKLLSDAETQMKEMVLEAKEEAHRIRMSLEQEVRDARAEIQRSERRVQQKEESIDRKLEDLDRKDQAVTAKELEIGRTRERVNDALAEQVKELERISGMTRAEARTTILTNLEKELNQEIAQKIRDGEAIVKEESEKRARNILVT
ncbi:MAG TPA: Rnase Y domain-containing protein, partial [Candidatus Dormibacteraeota bacterium]|nr:Rnase Y domain-containing protein [Candidatus Dormibacteraeota bacterium]